MPTVTPPGSPDPLGTWNRIICVDWGIEHAKRAAWIADVERATVSPLDVEPTVRALVAHAQGLPGRTLIGIDAALGIPKWYLGAAKAALPAWQGLDDFPSWLLLATTGKHFTDPAKQASEWRHDRPFIAVPRGGGVGSLTAFWDQAGGVLRREVDVATGGSSPFVVSGLPGTVGSGSRALWLEILELLTPNCDFALWPFDPADLLVRLATGRADRVG